MTETEMERQVEREMDPLFRVTVQVLGMLSQLWRIKWKRKW